MKRIVLIAWILAICGLSYKIGDKVGYNRGATLNPPIAIFRVPEVPCSDEVSFFTRPVPPGEISFGPSMRQEKLPER